MGIDASTSLKIYILLNVGYGSKTFGNRRRKLMTSVLLNFLFGFSFFILKKNLAFGKNLILFKNIVKGFFHMEFFLSGYIIFLLLDTINPGKRITAPLFNDILCCWKFENKKGD